VASERRPDVALMDIRINGDSDGVAVAAALSDQFGVPVVYLTAYTDDATLSRAASTRPYGYVVKPFTSREVRSAIEVARHKHAAEAEAAAGVRRKIDDPLSSVSANLGFLAASLVRMDAAIHDGSLSPSLAGQVEEMIDAVDEARLGAEQIRKVASGLATLAPRPPPALRLVEPPAVPAPERAKARILVVDDEVLVGRAVQRVLGRKHQVEVTDDPRGALRRLEAGEAFDLVLCDMTMPGLSGAELHQRLQEVRPQLAERVVFLTGGAFTPEGRKLLEASANARVDKPFDARTLEQAVEAALAKKASPP
jgi:CheY-like chemotaxis protein